MQNWLIVTCILAMLLCISAKANDSDAKDDYYGLLSSDGWLMRWPKKKFPLKVYIEDGSHIPGFRPQFRDILLGAFYSWTDASGGKLSFTKAASEKEADVICMWTKTLRADSELPSRRPTSGASIYEEFEEAGTGYISILKVRIKLPIIRPTNRLVVTNNEMRCTCLHEIGHALGIDIHSPDTADMMCRFNNAFKVRPVLSQRDVHTIQRLYSSFD